MGIIGCLRIYKESKFFAIGVGRDAHDLSKKT